MRYSLYLIVLIILFITTTTIHADKNITLSTSAICGERAIQTISGTITCGQLGCSELASTHIVIGNDTDLYPNMIAETASFALYDMENNPIFKDEIQTVQLQSNSGILTWSNIIQTYPSGTQITFTCTIVYAQNAVFPPKDEIVTTTLTFSVGDAENISGSVPSIRTKPAYPSNQFQAIWFTNSTLNHVNFYSEYSYVETIVALRFKLIGPFVWDAQHISPGEILSADHSTLLVKLNSLLTGNYFSTVVDIFTPFISTISNTQITPTTIQVEVVSAGEVEHMFDFDYVMFHANLEKIKHTATDVVVDLQILNDAQIVGDLLEITPSATLLSNGGFNDIPSGDERLHVFKLQLAGEIETSRFASPIGTLDLLDPTKSDIDIIPIKQTVWDIDNRGLSTKELVLSKIQLPQDEQIKSIQFDTEIPLFLSQTTQALSKYPVQIIVSYKPHPDAKQSTNLDSPTFYISKLISPVSQRGCVHSIIQQYTPHTNNDDTQNQRNIIPFDIGLQRLLSTGVTHLQLELNRNYPGVGFIGDFTKCTLVQGIWDSKSNMVIPKRDAKRISPKSATIIKSDDTSINMMLDDIWITNVEFIFNPKDLQVDNSYSLECYKDVGIIMPSRDAALIGNVITIGFGGEASYTKGHNSVPLGPYPTDRPIPNPTKPKKNIVMIALLGTFLAAVMIMGFYFTWSQLRTLKQKREQQEALLNTEYAYETI